MRDIIWRKILIIGLIIVLVELNSSSNISNSMSLGEVSSISNPIGITNSSSEEWNKTYGGESEDYFNFALETHSGYLFTGATSSYGSGGRDGWLMKIDTNGVEIWNKTYGGVEDDECLHVQQTSDGGYIIVGYTSSYGMGGLDVWLIKTDSYGNMLWNKTYGGLYDDIGFGVIPTSDNGFVIMATTYSFGNPWYGDIWLIKVDDQGNMLWNKTYGVYDEYGFCIHKTSDSGYIIVGYTKPCRSEDNIVSVLPGDRGEDIWLLKVDSYGNELWNKTYGGLYSDRGNYVEQTDDGGYIIVGNSITSEGGDYDLILIKTDSDGDELWEKIFGRTGGDDIGWCVHELKEGGYIVAGHTSSYGAGESDIWLIKTDSDGNMLWNKTFGGSRNDLGSYVLQTHDRGYLTVGETFSYGHGGDAWVIKVYDNQPPDTPCKPKGPTTGVAGRYYPYNTTSTDPEGDNIRYGWDWNGDNIVDEWTSYYPSGVMVSRVHSWILPGVYQVKVKAEDIHGLQSDFSAPLNVTIFSEINTPPDTPSKPVGPDNGVVGESLTYSTSTTDREDDEVRYGWDWNNDDVVDYWSNYYPSGATHQVTVTFNSPGVYKIRVKAEDIHGAESGFSPSKQVVITLSGNNPPNTPSKPSGSTSGNVGISYTYTTSAVDPDGDMIRYGWDWNGDDIVDEWTGYYTSGETVSITHSWNTPGTYHIKVKAEDENGAQSGFSSALTVTITGGNSPPNKPSRPSGPTNGRPGVSYTYTTSTSDPDGDQIYYKFSWGDGSYSEWLGPYNSGDIVSASHSWSSKGNYEIRVKAKDTHGIESEWSDPLPISMPKFFWLNLLPVFIQRIISINLLHCI